MNRFINKKAIMWMHLVQAWDVNFFFGTLWKFFQLTSARRFRFNISWPVAPIFSWIVPQIGVSGTIHEIGDLIRTWIESCTIRRIRILPIISVATKCIILKKKIKKKLSAMICSSFCLKLVWFFFLAFFGLAKTNFFHRYKTYQKIKK